MSERALPGRKRKKASKGRIIRVSDRVYSHLNKNRAKRSFDELFRKMFGLPDREGTPQPLVEGWIEITTGQFFLDEADARGASVVAAARAKTKNVNKPIKVRELV